jgi:hypothetical protein
VTVLIAHSRLGEQQADCTLSSRSPQHERLSQQVDEQLRANQRRPLKWNGPGRPGRKDCHQKAVSACASAAADDAGGAGSGAGLGGLAAAA